MGISVSASSEEQAEKLQRTLKIMTMPDNNGNSWLFKQLFMYPTFDSEGLYYTIVIKFVDKNNNPLFTTISRNNSPKHSTTTPWEEIQ
jgi:hypothetical protein